MSEYNQGYEIIAAEAYGTTEKGRECRIVLGRMETKYGVKFVTWESVIGVVAGDGYADYFWGHYFCEAPDAERRARADFHRRLLDHYLE